MPLRQSPQAFLLPAALLLTLSACAPDQPSNSAGGPAGAPSPATVSTSATPAAPSTQASTPSAAPTPSPSPSAVKRTSAQLKGALLTLDDLPAGFEVEKSGEGDGAKVSSSKKACAPLVRLMNSSTLAGSRAQAEASFSGGQEGPFVDETLDAMGTAQAARASVEKYRSAVKACRTVKVSLPGVGSSNFAVREISFAELADDTFAARFMAAGGPLEGLEIIEAAVQSDDVVIGTTAVGLDGPDAEAATEDAVAKVAKKLGTSGTA